MRRKGLAYFARSLPLRFREPIERRRHRRARVLAKRPRVALESFRSRASVLMLAEQVLERFGLERRLVERLVGGREELELVAQPLRADAQAMQVFGVRLVPNLPAELEHSLQALLQVLVDAVRDLERAPAPNRPRAGRVLEQRAERSEQLVVAIVAESLGHPRARLGAFPAEVQLIAAELGEALGGNGLRVGAKDIGMHVEVARIAERACECAQALAKLLRFPRQHAPEQAQRNT